MKPVNMGIENLLNTTSKIQWTDFTWNPWHGCKKVSPGCKYCYMYRDKERYGQDPTTVLKSKSTFNKPLQLQKQLNRFEKKSGLEKQRSLKIFTCSWSDFFIEEADEWRPEAWEIIRKTPEFTYQILTKRPERILANLPEGWQDGYQNVWLGVSIESQKQIHRIKTLSEVPSTVRFVSAEPLIGPIDILHSPMVDWVIIGGESGNNNGKYTFRPCSLTWIQSLVDQCIGSFTPVFIKQMGTFLANINDYKDIHGGDWMEWPESLRIREFPA